MLLIDGDILAYKVSAVCEEPVDWGDDLWTLHADAREGRVQVDTWLDQIQDDLGILTGAKQGTRRGIRVFLTGSFNFRTELFPEYKANRRGTRKPMILGEMKRHLETAWGGESEKRLEADDLIGMAASRTASSEFSPIIVSIDKDFKTVPWRLYNPDKPELGVVEITDEQADYWFMYQTLTGDSSDNYGGCPGVGPKKAEKLLENKTTLYDMWQVVLKAYDSSGLSSRHALTQARVARILRYGEYNFGMGKVKLWNPPKEPK